MSSRAEYMLKYQKAKVKLLEYNVSQRDYPKFRLDSQDLSFPTIWALSEYADAVIQASQERKDGLSKSLSFCSEYYDAAFKSREDSRHDIDFLITGAVAYFFDNNFGSAKILCLRAAKEEINGEAQNLLIEVMYYALIGEQLGDSHHTIVDSFINVIKDGGNEIQLLQEVDDYNDECLEAGNPSEAFFAELLAAIVRIACINSARRLIPQYTGLSSELWNDYYSQRASIKMMWPAQKLIGECGILKGANGIVQLPTGVGKTKSIELIIRSMFLAERGHTALIVAPLRALCNEIAVDMRKGFSKENVQINQFSEILKIDIFSGEIAHDDTIFVCTPEKLQYLLHHVPEYMNQVDLYIFDEGHMFDDESRGALYELLVTDIKMHMNSDQQIVLMSAVLPNSKEIGDWLFEENGVIAYDPTIKSTPKELGFSSKERGLYYYSDNFSAEDYYVPNAVRFVELRTKRKTKNRKVFPEIESSQDLAIYFSNVLCKNGGVAIYLNQKRSIPKLLNRVVEVAGRGVLLDNIKNSADSDESYKIKNLISLHYGASYILTQICDYGIFAHYAALPNGVKLSIEHAFRNRKISVVACTSTLAQGVNIPIKYLVMTSIKAANVMMLNRGLQNLVGRTARSGVYTEGSVILTDTKLFDNKKSGKGYYDWKNATELFDPQKSEACKSAILSIVQDFNADYEFYVEGKYVTDYICEHISEEWFTTLPDEIVNDIASQTKRNLSQCAQNVKSRILSYKESIDKIENEMSYMMGLETIEFEDKKLLEAKNNLLSNLLASSLANEEEGKRLGQLFDAIYRNAKEQIPKQQAYNRSMLSIEANEVISSWIEKHEMNTVFYPENDLIIYILELYTSLYPEDAINEDVCYSWVKGASYEYIKDNYDLTFADIEKMCGTVLSFKMSFLVGNIVDCIDSESDNIGSLTVLQQKLKYGVNSLTSISICEKVFDDRIVADIITQKLGNNDIEPDVIENIIRSNRENVLSCIEDYPSYFTNKIKYL